jgi:hypothetical protein
VRVGRIYAHITLTNFSTGLFVVFFLAIVICTRVSSVFISPLANISRDVVFDEKTFPFVALHSTAGASYSFDVLLLPYASIGNNLTTDADESSTCFPLPVFGSCVQSQVAATSGSASVLEVAGPDPMPNPPLRSTATPARALPSTTSSTAPVVHRHPPLQAMQIPFHAQRLPRLRPLCLARNCAQLCQALLACPRRQPLLLFRT